MKIGIYDPYLDTLSGGEKYILYAASCLAKKNRVDVFWDDKSILEKASKKLNIDTDEIIIKPNIFSEKYPFFNRLRKTSEYDRLLILSDGSIPLTLAKKTILHFQFPVEQVDANGLKTRFKLLKIDKIICNSLFTKEFIDRKFKTECLVLYPPCLKTADIKAFSDTSVLRAKKNFILTVGRYSPLPGGGSIKKLETMIAVFKKMIDSGLKHWEFLAVVSFFPENEKYINMLEENSKNYPIKILKNIDYEKLKEMYNQAKIYWHAAGFGEDLSKFPEKAEHFGITTVEAMAHGVVPVVINKGGQPEIVDRNVDGFLWEDPDELESFTKRLMMDPSLRGKMADFAIKKSEQFTFEKFCVSIHDLIK